MRQFLALLFAFAVNGSSAAFTVVDADQSIAGVSAYPTAIDPAKVGRYPASTKSGGGYFYDDVLEYRVWLHPERGAEKRNGTNDYVVAFAQYEKALEFSKRAKGAEQPLVLVRQLRHINEPRPGVFEVVEGERLTEWQVAWLNGSKRTPNAIENFLKRGRK